MNQRIREKLTADELVIAERLDFSCLPRHIAVIMDGNGRWATQQSFPRVVGHRAGAESVRAIIDSSDLLGIAHLTLYSFSTENWTRPDSEVQALMQLIEEHLKKELAEMHEKGVRVNHIGRTDGLPDSLCRTLADSMALTRENTGLRLNLAINYSGRTEIADAARELARRAARGELAPDAIDEETISGALYTAGIPDPDLLIRTAGELRVSNYLLWQIAYSEFWVTETLWPDFRTIHLLAAIEEFQRRRRKFGGVTS